MSLDKMLEEVKSFSELKAFSEAQQKTILKLSKKNKEQEEELSELRKQLDSLKNNQVVPASPESSLAPINSETFLASDQETICRVELSKLKQNSFERELTLEEAKRVDIYSKILNVIENNPKTIKAETKNVSNQELIEMIQSEESFNE